MNQKLLFILNSLTAGGAEKQTISLVNSLDRDQFEISLVYLDAVETLLPQIDSKRSTVLECMHRKKRLDRRVIRKIRRRMDAEQYDIVVCIGQYPLVYAFLGRLPRAQRFHIVQVVHLTTPLPDIWTSIKNRCLYRYLMNRCERLVFVCNNQMIYWVERFAIRRDKSTFIYNGVDVDRFSDTWTGAEKQRLRERFGFTKDDFVVGICAALRPEKKHTDFVDAIGLARRDAPNIKGLIIGEGALRNEIQRYIETNGMTSTIKMAGFQHDVRPFIGICDCMALTSRAVEAFSISALEAMAMAKPMVMTNLGGANEQIEHGVSGFIYEKGDVGKLAGWLAALHKDNTSAEMGARARERVRRYFTTDNMVKEYTRLFSAMK